MSIEDKYIGYSNFLDENEEATLGTFEVFYQSGSFEPGWYWWTCSPGCLPDDEPHGPFGSAKAAFLDARNSP